MHTFLCKCPLKNLALQSKDKDSSFLKPTMQSLPTTQIWSALKYSRSHWEILLQQTVIAVRVDPSQTARTWGLLCGLLQFPNCILLKYFPTVAITKLERFEVVLSTKLEPHSSDSKQITPALLQCIETKLPLSTAYPLSFPYKCTIGSVLQLPRGAKRFRTS